MQGKDYEDYKITLTQRRKDQAIKAYEEARYEKAIAFLTPLILDFPDDIYALNLRANALQKLARNEEAELDFRKVEELKKRDQKILSINSSSKAPISIPQRPQFKFCAVWPIQKVELNLDEKMELDAYYVKLKKDPNNFHIITCLAKLKAKAGLYEEAMELVHRFKKSNPIASFHILDLENELNVTLGRYEQAMDYFVKETERHPKDHKLWLRFGRLKCLLGNYEDALPAFAKAFKLISANRSEDGFDRDEHEIYRDYAGLLHYLGQDQEALQVISKAKFRVHENHRFFNTLWGGNKNVISEYNMIKQICDASKERLKDLKIRGRANLKSYQFDHAVIDFSQAIKLDPKTASNWELRGRAYHGLKHYVEAISDYDEAIRLDPNRAVSLRGRGAAKYCLGRYKEAVSDCTASLKLDPKSSFAYQNRGRAYKCLKLYEEAYNDFYEQSILNPTKSAEACHDMGSVKEESGCYELAIQLYIKALAIDPLHTNSWNKLVELVKQKSKLCEKAISDFNRAIQSDPQNLSLLRLTAKFSHQLGRYENALSYWDKIIELDPESATDWAQRAAVCILLGRHEQACSDFERASILDPQNSEYSLQYNKLFADLAWPDHDHSGAKPQAYAKVNSSKKHFVDSSTTDTSGSRFPMPRDDLETTAVSVTTQRKITALRRANDQVEQRIKVRESRNGKEKISAEYPGKNPDLDVKVEVSRLSIISKEELKEIKLLREGQFGIIYQGVWQGGAALCQISVAIKKLKTNGNLSDSTLLNFRNEVEIHAKLDCPAIVKLLGISEDKNQLSMVMELVELGSLQEVLDQQSSNPYQHRIDWGIRLQIAKDIAIGVNYLHGQNPKIVHGDLKSLNILLGLDYHAKLCDFGLSKFKSDLRTRYYYEEVNSQEKKPKGTLAWMAPELFNINAMRTDRSDIYSLAVVFWELASFMLPFLHAEDAMIKLCVTQGQREEFSDDKTPETPEEYRSLVESCWDGDPNNRPKAGEVLAKLEAIYSKNPLVKTLFPKESTIKEKDDFNIRGSTTHHSTSGAKKVEGQESSHSGSYGAQIKTTDTYATYSGNVYFVAQSRSDDLKFHKK